MKTIAPLPLLALLALAAGCAEKPAPAPQVKPVRAIQVKAVESAGVDRYTGVVRARHESPLAFRVAGKVLAREVELGQRVRAGQVLARLDAADYRLAAQSAAEQLDAARVDARQAAADAARFKALAAEGALGDADRERQQSRADATAARVAQAEAQLQMARNQADYTLLRAPVDGIVTSLDLEPGQVVAAGQPLLTLARPGEKEIVVDIPEQRLAAARTASASATLWTNGSAAFPVRLREIAPVAAAGTRTFRARYSAPPRPGMELGMTATLTLSGGGTPVAAVELPATALLQHRERPAVWVVDRSAGRLQLTEVGVVAYGQETVRVSGLADGSWVVTAGVQKLDPGLAVAVWGEPPHAPARVAEAGQ